MKDRIMKDQMFVKMFNMKLYVSQQVTLDDYFDNYHNKPDFLFLFLCTWSGSFISVDINDAIRNRSQVC